LIEKLNGFDHRSSHVGFVVGKMALGHVFPKYFGFRCSHSPNYSTFIKLPIIDTVVMMLAGWLAD
jgi:hypothetical protein